MCGENSGEAQRRELSQGWDQLPWEIPVYFHLSKETCNKTFTSLLPFQLHNFQGKNEPARLKNKVAENFLSGPALGFRFLACRGGILAGEVSDWRAVPSICPATGSEIPTAQGRGPMVGARGCWCASKLCSRGRRWEKWPASGEQLCIPSGT